MAKSKRTKAESTINNIEEFGVALDELALVTIELESLGLKLEEKIAEVRSEHAPAIDALTAKIKTDMLALEKFAIDNRATLFPGELKSAEATLATYGFRAGNPTLALLNNKWTWEAVIGAIKAQESRALAVMLTSKDPQEVAAQQRWQDLIATEEAPVKDRIKAVLSAEDQALIGCKTKQPESFWVEPKREAVAERRLTTSGTEVAA